MDKLDATLTLKATVRMWLDLRALARLKRTSMGRIIRDILQPNIEYLINTLSPDEQDKFNQIREEIGL